MILTHDEKNKIKKYREENPHCRFCKYHIPNEIIGFWCGIDNKHYCLNKAKRCQFYAAFDGCIY